MTFRMPRVLFSLKAMTAFSVDLLEEK